MSPVGRPVDAGLHDTPPSVERNTPHPGVPAKRIVVEAATTCVTDLYSRPVFICFQVPSSCSYFHIALGAKTPATIVPKESEARQRIEEGIALASIFLQVTPDVVEW
jgi:hypothetical protein